MNSRASPSSSCRSDSRLTICAFHRNVEGGDRLVADDEVGARGERAGDADALALAAGELVREALHRVARQPHLVHQRDHAVLQFARVLGEAEVHDRLGDAVAHALGAG